MRPRPRSLSARETDVPARRARAAIRVLAAALLAAAAVAALPTASAAQQAGADRGDTAWFPDSTAFRPLLAAPREVDLRGSLVVADRRAPAGADFEGGNLEAEVVLGHRIGVVRLRSEDRAGPEIVLGFEVGVFNRFALETSEKDLIGVDYRVGLPLSLRTGPWSGRLVLLHESSHLGDDFVARFGPPDPRRQVTRDGFELTVARELTPALRAYGGADLNFHANPGVERVAARGGLEWDPAPDRTPGPGGGLQVWPFAAGNLELTSETSGAAVTGAAGLALRVSGMTLRLEARGHTGPSPLGQLDGRDEDFLGLGLRVDPL